eukprot:1387752-Amphidinium_carterae.1
MLFKKLKDAKLYFIRCGIGSKPALLGIYEIDDLSKTLRDMIGKVSRGPLLFVQLKALQGAFCLQEMYACSGESEKTIMLVLTFV